MARSTLGTVVDAVIEWWDGIELWVVQLWFPLQFVVVMAVVVPLCLAAAWLIDRAVDHASARLRG
ncbi:MAG: hypothetical protein ACRDQW_13335 [Haloechinothrix sp.]